jgi:hypothetical protein
VRPSRKFLPALLAAFLAPQFVCAQMPNRPSGASPNGPPSAEPPSEPEPPAQSDKPQISRAVYITDFELDSADQPATQAQHILKLMSENLLKDFAKAGYAAKLLKPSDPRPDDGFLVTGVFARVGHDNRLRRAVLGAGQSAEPLQLYVAAKDLAHFTAPLYQPDPTDASATKDGAAIVLNPNADPVKFALEADLGDKTIKQTAQRIANELAKRINTVAKSDYEPLNKYAKP